VTRWLARGRSDPDGPYATFAEAVDSRHELETEASVERSGVPDREEVVLLLSAAARAGSVSAQKVLLAWHDRHNGVRALNPLDQFDELARRRDRT
jgi:hypothetical protein